MATTKEPLPPNPNLPTNAETIKFEAYNLMLNAAYDEMKELTKTKPNETISELKTETLNKLYASIRKLLKKEPSAELLNLFDKKDLPTYSDAIIVLVQYRSAMTHFMNNYFGIDSRTYQNRWFTKENPGVPERE